MKKNFLIGLVIVGAITFFFANQVQAATIVVPGTSDIWLAGMPDGSSASGWDTAPQQSPILVTSLNISVGDLLTFEAVGGVANGSGLSLNGPDGGTFGGQPFIHHDAGAENGISDLTTPINSLVGLFLDDAQPNLTPAPISLDFSSIGLDFSTLSPDLKQVFFIGDGQTGAGEAQIFNVPTGATRLFLGTMDGFGWNDNSGSFTVGIESVPIPGALWLLGSGLAGIAGIRLRRKKK